MALVGDGVVAVLGDPALGEAVGGPGVHQTMVEAHANDGRTMSLNLLKKLNMIKSNEMDNQNLFFSKAFLITLFYNIYLCYFLSDKYSTITIFC